MEGEKNGLDCKSCGFLFDLGGGEGKGEGTQSNIIIDNLII